MLKTLKEFCVVFGKWSWFLIIELFGGLIGFVQSVRTDFGTTWIVVLGFSMAAMVGSAFAAFHRMRVQRDEARSHFEAQKGNAADRLRNLYVEGLAMNERIRTGSYSDEAQMLRSISDWQSRIAIFLDDGRFPVLSGIQFREITAIGQSPNASRPNEIQNPYQALHKQIEMISRILVP